MVLDWHKTKYCVGEKNGPQLTPGAEVEKKKDRSCGEEKPNVDKV